MYHNTTHSRGAELRRYNSAAMTQAQKALCFFKEFTPMGWTASEVHDRLIRKGQIRPQTPLTSIRRAMTDLVNDDLLVKTTKQRKGPLGRSEYLYRLPSGQLELI